MSDDYGLGMILGVAIGNLVRHGMEPDEIRRWVEGAIHVATSPPHQEFIDALEAETRSRLAEMAPK